MEGLKLGREELARLLDITEPFLMLDEVEGLRPGKSAQGRKALAAGDWFFKCHLPHAQAMPGTLLIEAMLQTLVLTLYTMPGHEGKLSYVTDIKTQLLAKVSPGGELVLDAALLSYRRGIAKGEVVGTVSGKTVCRGQFSYASPHDFPAVPKAA